MGYSYFDIQRLTSLEIAVLQLGELVKSEQEQRGQGDGPRRHRQREQAKAAYRDHFYGES